MTGVTAKPMTLGAYAQRRGVSAMTVSRAVAKGKLRASVAWKGEGTDRKPVGILDPVLADREWEANSDYTDAPQRAAAATASAVAARSSLPKPASLPETLPAPDPETPINLQDAALHEKLWKAHSAELNYRRDAGELVEAAKVRATIEDMVTRCKSRLLAIPARVKQALPHLTVTDLAELESLIREALEELAGAKL